MSNETKTVIAPPDKPPTPPTAAPRPFIESGVDYVLKEERVGIGLHHRVKDLGDGSVEVTRLINENIKVKMSAADFEKFYKKV